MPARNGMFRRLVTTFTGILHGDRPARTTSLAFTSAARVVAVLAAAMLVSCGGMERATRGTGALAIRSIGEQQATLVGDFSSGIYRYHDQNSVTVLLFDGPEDNPNQVMAIRMLWRPRAARTPISADATNATIRHIIFTGGTGEDVGVYAGGGFIYPRSNIGEERISIAIWSGTIRLTDRSDGFTDRLGEATVEGRFTARRDDTAVDETLRRLNGSLRERLGYPRLVQITSDETSPAPRS